MKRLLLVVLWLCAAAPLLQAQVADVYGDRKLQPVSQFMQVFFDSTDKLTPQQLAQPAMLAKFRPSAGEYENLNIRSETVWLHFRAVRHSTEACFISYEGTLTNDVRLYRHNNGKWDELISGTEAPLFSRPVRSNMFAFPLEEAVGDTGDYFIRIRSDLPVILYARAGSATGFWQYQFRDSLFAGIFLGIMLVVTLYNLFLYVTNRDRVYLYYVLYVITTVLFISLTSGYIVALPDFFRAVFVHTHMLFPSLFGYFGLLFTIRFLNTAKWVPGIHRFFYGVMVVVAINFILSFFLPHLSTMIIQFIGLILSTLCLVTGIIVYRKGYAPARYYLLGFGVYMIGLLSYIVLVIISVDTGFFTPPRILMISSAIEAIILSFAIGDKLNIALREKQAANDKVMDAIRENERIVREQNAILEKKVEERTQEIRIQKFIIEEKNKDILDSIHYAKRIQRALLASDTVLNKNLPEHFVLYRPKDIVSGDFYWAAEAPGDKFLLLTGDCTGHGVPGAFMSLLNISILHELTSGIKMEQPEKILNAQRYAIIMALNPEGSEEISKDGMDCVLCSFDFKNRKLAFACANNPLWVLRNGEMLDIRPDKFPVGLHEGEQKPFTRHEMDLLPGDIVYTFTDGFADQFGGPRGKKFKYAQLKETLIANAALPMHEQKTRLEQVFDDWKGELDQLDDMLVIGVKVR